MSTSPGDSRRPGAVVSATRTLLVVASLIVVASSTSAFAAFPDVPASPNLPAAVQPLPVVAAITTTPFESPARPLQAPDDDCSRFLVGSCEEAPLAANPPPTDQDPSCRLRGEHQGEGSTSIVSAKTARPTAEPAVRYRIEIEDGLAIDAECFAETVGSILNDPRGWTADGSFRFEQVGDDTYDLRLILASPQTTDALCYPAGTGGKYSCRNRDKVVLNLMRWEDGTDEYEGELDTYRHYLVNHEVGHLLGHGHRSCPDSGAAAPVMMQQTKGLGDCSPNGWPTEDER